MCTMCSPSEESNHFPFYLHTIAWFGLIKPVSCGPQFNF